MTPVGKHHQISEALHAETSHVIFLQRSKIAAPPFPCLALVTPSWWHPQGGSPWPPMDSQVACRGAHSFILKDASPLLSEMILHILLIDMIWHILLIDMIWHIYSSSNNSTVEGGIHPLSL